MISLFRLIFVAFAVALAVACGANAPRPSGPGPEYEDPPVIGTPATDAGPGDASAS